MAGEINCEGLIGRMDFIKDIAHVLNSAEGFVITVPGGSGYTITVPTPMEDDVRVWIRALLIAEIRELSVYTVGEPKS